MKFLLRQVLVVALAFSCLTAHASDELDQLLAQGLEDLMEIQVVTPGRQPQRIAQAPANVTAITAAVTASALAHQRDRFLDEGFDNFIDKPFRCERIYGCLHEILGTTFEFGEGEAEPAPIGDISLDSLVSVASVLPDVLFDGLLQATLVGDINATREHLDKIHEMGGDASVLASQLRAMAHAYDMRGIADWLESIQR